MYRHIAVAHAAVIGMPDETWGEAVCAVVQLQPGAVVSAVELIDFCRTQIASYKKPRQVIFVDELPKLPSGKINKLEIRRRIGAIKSRHEEVWRCLKPILTRNSRLTSTAAG